MTEVSEDYRDDAFYIPHHAVCRSDSLTTKLRVVFDASAKTDTGLSLNDTLMVEPVIQDKLFFILLRFRLYVVAITADVEKMYRQVNVKKQDRVYQRILWRDNPGLPVKTYQLNTLTYGATPASYLATTAIKKLADDDGQRYPLAARVATKDMYVDDLITGANSFREAAELRNELIQLFSGGGFFLRKWATNSPALFQDMQNHSNDQHLYLELTQSQKTLGIHWQPDRDELRYKIHQWESTARITKRTILSQVSSLFDPLGLILPSIIIAKILLQSSWQLKINWDESVPEDMSTSWIAFRRHMSALQELAIPRAVLPEDWAELQLHGFCDASEAAYGSCLYVRAKTTDGRTWTRLLCARSRIAPLKKVTLPRLELCAAVLLAELLDHVIMNMDLKFDHIHLWSDSTIVLCWIATSPHKLKNFVGNRVAKIQELTNPSIWSHIPTQDNPADLLSRGLSPSKLVHNSFWFEGPSSRLLLVFLLGPGN